MVTVTGLMGGSWPFRVIANLMLEELGFFATLDVPGKGTASMCRARDFLVFESELGLEHHTDTLASLTLGMSSILFGHLPYWLSTRCLIMGLF